MKLQQLNWNPRNFTELTRFSRDIRPGDLAVFDWDNTCICGDIGEALLRHMTENLAFRIDAEALAELLPVCVNGVDKVIINGRKFWLQEMKDEIARAHKKISALGAIAAKAELSGPYQDFCAGLLALNRGLETTPGIGCEFAYPWVNQFFREMTPGELTQMASTVINEQLRVPIRELSISDTRQRWSYAWDSGIRIYREMKDLAAVFLDRGAEVVVSSASNRQLVEKMIVMTAFPCRRVIGMALPVSDGRFGAGLETGLRPNLGPGKVENIRFHIGREPVFAAGDSDNDAELLSSFASTRMRLIVGRGSGKKIAALARRALAKEAGYLWQGVDKCKGKFSDQRDATDQLF